MNEVRCEYVHVAGPVPPQQFASTQHGCHYCRHLTQNYCQTHSGLSVCESCEPAHDKHAQKSPRAWSYYPTVKNKKQK